MRIKQSMKSERVQTNHCDFMHNVSSQTQIVVKYDQ